MRLINHASVTSPKPSAQIHENRLRVAGWVGPLADLPATVADAQRAAEFDIVLANGRVMDPESELNAVRHVGIRNGKIAAISTTALKGRTVVEAKGMVVTAGFIDLHSHGQDDENYRFKARDGVTTALEMEVGSASVAAWYAQREGKSLINFGVTAGHVPARMAVLKDSGAWLPRDSAIAHRATAEENRQIKSLIQQGLDEGALGMGFGIAYVTGTRRDEIFDLFQLAAERKVTCFVHARSHGAVRTRQRNGILSGNHRRRRRHGRFVAYRSFDQHGLAANTRLFADDRRRAQTRR